MKKFIGTQISRFFNSGKWALKLIFLVVIVELGIVVGAIATQELDENDSNIILHQVYQVTFVSHEVLQSLSSLYHHHNPMHNLR